MFTSLAQFYTSDLWKDFRRRMIAENMAKHGGRLIDEYNGEEILKAFDAVAHHKKPLTMQNVNDYSISLNPENIMIVSHKSHNEIHSRFGYCAQRKVYYVYGSPCSGKTSFVNGVKGNSDLVIDMDNIWQCITGGARYDKPNALKTVAFIVRDSLLDAVKTRAGKWERAYIITGGAVKSQREREIAALGAEPIYIEASKEDCIKHLYNDSTRTDEQRAAWMRYIEKWFEDFDGE